MSKNDEFPAQPEQDEKPNAIGVDADSQIADEVPLQAPQFQGPAAHSAARGGSSKAFFIGFLRLVFQLILVVGIGFGGYQGFNALIADKPEPIKRKARERVWVIETAPALRQNITPQLTLFGETVARRTVNLRSFVGGQVTAVSHNLREGLIVKQGEALVEIDQFDYKGAWVEARAQMQEAQAGLREINAQVKSEEAGLEFAKTQVDFAKRDLERIKQLRKSGSATDKTVDDRSLLVSQRTEQLTQKENNFAVLKAKADQKLAQIDRLNWALERAERNLKDTVLRAPFDGVVVEQNAEIGRLITVNDMVASLMDVGAIDARFTMPDTIYGRLTAAEGNLIGRPVQIVWSVGGAKLNYQGTISRISAKITAASGGVDLFASVNPNEKLPPLRPGAFVDLVIPDVTFEDVILLPQTAVYDASHIFVMENERLRRADIEVKGTTGNDILIKADVPAEAQIMTTRLPQAGNGIKVRLRGDAPQKERAQMGKPNKEKSGKEKPDGAKKSDQDRAKPGEKRQKPDAPKDAAPRDV